MKPTVALPLVLLALAPAACLEDAGDPGPGVPDAAPGFPDARPGFPDSHPGFPDARPCECDAPPAPWPDAIPTIGLAVEVSPARVAPGGRVTVLVSTYGSFRLEPAAGQANEPGAGHYHVSLDDTTGIPHLGDDWRPSIDVTIPAGTPPGPHRVVVTLANHDHTRYAGAWYDTVQNGADLTIE